MVKGIDLKVERIRAGVNQQQLAELIGISRQTLGTWEGRETIPPYKAEAYREALSRLVIVEPEAAA
jgi:DNA-binding XRE family transcriptional regulator